MALGGTALLVGVLVPGGTSGATAEVPPLAPLRSVEMSVNEAPTSLASAIYWAKLTAPDGAPSDIFGISVAASGDTAVVGAWSDDTLAGLNAGSAYVFVRFGTDWIEQAHLTAPHGASEDRFGAAVAVSGDTAVVGAYQHDTPAGLDAGSAYVFVRSGAVWTYQASLNASDGAAFDNFGGSVAVSDGTALVGAPLDDPGVGFDAGSAYVFGRSGTSWIEQAKLTAPDANSYDYFGDSVAVDEDTAVVVVVGQAIHELGIAPAFCAGERAAQVVGS